jgi:hypothetical protein
LDLIQQSLHGVKPILAIQSLRVWIIVVTELNSKAGELGKLQIGSEINTLLSQDLEQIRNVVRA